MDDERQRIEIKNGLENVLQEARDRKEEFGKTKVFLIDMQTEVEKKAMQVSQQVSYHLGTFVGCLLGLGLFFTVSSPVLLLILREITPNNISQVRDVFEVQLKALKQRQHELLLQVRRCCTTDPFHTVDTASLCCIVGG